MVDSAPELRLIRPSVSTPSNVTPVEGSYTASPDGFAPKNQPPANPASTRSPGPPPAWYAASTPASRPCAPYAICASAGAGAHALFGPPVHRTKGVNVPASASATRTQSRRRRTAPARAKASGAAPPHACQKPSEPVHGRIAPNGHARVESAPIAATPSA